MISRLLFFTGIFITSITYGQIQIGDDIEGEAAGDLSGYSFGVSSDGSIIAIGAVLNSGNGGNSGHVRVYENQGGTWTQIGQDIDGENGQDRSGSSVDISSDGTIVAIGAIENDGNGTASGHVRIYENQSGTWTQIGQDIDGEDSGDGSGRVALSSDGSIVAIGASGNDGNGDNTGHVRIYENQSGTWTQIGQDIEGESVNDFSGRSVDISSDGSIVAIGATGDDGNGGNSGHVRVFENQSGTWIQVGQDIDGEDELNESGWSLSLSADGSVVAIGAPSNLGDTRTSNGFEAPGHVRVFENQGGTWTQIGDDIDGENSIDASGFSVSLSSDGSLVAIGATQNSDNGSIAGHVRIYKNQGGTWTQVGDDIDGENPNDESGFYVRLSSSGDTMAIGAVGNDGNGGNSGHVRVYDLSTVLNTQENVLTDFSLYPNPAINSVIISLRDDDLLERATIYNSLGQKIIQSTQSIIDVSSLSKGLYIVEIETSTSKGSEKLIIK